MLETHAAMMAALKLTAAQTEWLLIAYRAGYDHGFSARYNRALGRLVALGYIERNPTSLRNWRIVGDLPEHVDRMLTELSRDRAAKRAR